MDNQIIKTKQLDDKIERTILNNNANIQFIYHLADIHIHQLERHEEYREVFNRLFKRLKDEETGLILLLGDLVHDNCKLSSESIQLLFELMNGLGNIPNLGIIVITGNHDAIVKNNNRLDALSPIMDNLHNKNVHYIKKEGIYEFGNIIFGISSVFQNNHIIDAKEITSDKTKICLFHGAVDEVLLSNGIRLKNNQHVVADFEGYDYGMLGDVHKFQYMGPKKNIAYCGSLIQQNFGESIKEHGYIKWDLINKTSKLVTILNDYGYHNITIQDGKIEPIEELSKKSHLKIRVKNTDMKKIDEIITTLSKQSSIQSHMIEYIEDDIKIGSINSKIDNFTNTDYKTIFKKYLETVKDIDSSDVTKLCTMFAHDLDKIDVKHEMSNNWKLVKMTFSNMFTYDEDNEINFENKNNIVGILADNGTGKSSLIDIMLYCLYEKCSRIGKTTRFAVLNVNKKKFSCELVCEIGNNQYHIQRTGSSNYSYDVDFWMMENNIKKSLKGTSVTETNDNIIKYFGTYENITKMNILLQNDVNGFACLKQNDRKDFLKKIYKLDMLNDVCQTIRKKKYETEADLRALEKNKINDSLDNIQNKNKIAEHELEIEIEKKDNIEKHIYNLREKLLLQSKKFKDCNISQDIIKENHFNKDIVELHQILLEIPKKIAELSSLIPKTININIEIENELFIKKKEDIINNLRESIEKLIESKHNIEFIDIDRIITNQKNQQLMKQKSDQRLNEHKLNLNKKTEIVNILKGKLNDIQITDNEYGVLFEKKQRKNIIESDINNLTDKLNIYNDRLESLEKHEYNINCNVCMKNNKDIIIEKQTNHTKLELLEQEQTALKQELNNINIIDIDNQIKSYQSYKKDKENYEININTIDSIKKNILIEEQNQEIIIEKLNALTNQTNLFANNKIRIDENDIIDNKISLLKKDIKVVENKINLDYIQHIQDLEYNNSIENRKLKILSNLNDINICKIKQEAKIKEYIVNNLENAEIKMKNIYNKYIEATILSIKREIVMTETVYQSILANIEGYETIIQDNNDKISTIMKDNKRHDELRKKKQLYSIYERATGRDGIPKMIITFAIPALEEQINSIISCICDFRIKIVIDENEEINIFIIKNNQRLLIESSSWSEKFIINMAIRIHFSKSCKLSKPNFIFFDEGFTSFDKKKLQLTKNVFDYLKTRYQFVLVITHLEQLEAFFDQTFNISVKKPYSHICI